MIQNRHLWKDQTEQMLPGHNGRSNIVYDEAGTVHCYDRSSSPIVRHPMAYIGYEPQRETLKYRCPARHEAGRAGTTPRATRANPTARRSALTAPSTCDDFRPSREPRRNSSGSTTAARRWNGSMPG